MQEHEVKFLNIRPKEIEKKLKALGAKKRGEYFYRRKVFDYPDWRLDKDHSWLRLRDEGDRVTLSFKKRLGVSQDGVSNDKGMEEIEIEVSDFFKTADLILKLGFIEKHYAENKRVRWMKDGVEFDIDTYPRLKPFLEIEAPTEKKIIQAIRWLGLNPINKKVFSTNQIYKLNGIHLKYYSRISFKGLVRRKKKQ